MLRNRPISSRPAAASSMRKMMYVAWNGVGRGRSTPLWMSWSSSFAYSLRREVAPEVLEAFVAAEERREDRRVGQ